jgi:hypothetical protein
LRIVLADTLYWIAIFLPNNPWTTAAKAVDLGDAQLVTTEEVLSDIYGDLPASLYGTFSIWECTGSLG